jgi:predicted phosphodiesterase
MENPTGTKWRDRLWVRENLPLWKRIFKGLGRTCMVALFFGLIVVGIVLFDLEQSQVTSPAPISFFGGFLPTYVVAIIGGIAAFGGGALGSFSAISMIIRFLQKKPYKLTWKPKIGAVVVAVMAIIVVQYYEPFWSVDARLYMPSFGPYIAIYDQTTMEISWDTPTPVQNTLIWGTSATNMANSVVGQAMYNSTETTSTHHIVLLTGLTPGATYYYEILGFENTVYSFKMAPAPGSTMDNVTFTIVGDTHGNFEVCKQNVATMRQTAPNLAFTMIAGDLSSYDDDLAEWASLFDMASYGGLTTTIPWMNVCGNHETYSLSPSSPYRSYYETYFEYNYANRTVQPGLPDYGLYYSFNYSNVHVTVLDCMENTSGYFSNAQIQWLKSDLANNSNMWKFVTFHYPMYSDGDPTSLVDMDQILEPIFYQYHVDAVFWGHAHDFEAFKANSTYYFTLGQGGGILDPLTRVSVYGSHAWPSTVLNVSQEGTRFSDVYGSQYQLYGELTQGFMQVSIANNSTCTFTDYRTDGSVVQQYTLTH